MTKSEPTDLTALYVVIALFATHWCIALPAVLAGVACWLKKKRKVSPPTSDNELEVTSAPLKGMNDDIKMNSGKINKVVPGDVKSSPKNKKKKKAHFGPKHVMPRAHGSTYLSEEEVLRRLDPSTSQASETKFITLTAGAQRPTN